MPPRDRPTAAVLGLGVVGGSLALALRRTQRFREVVGWDPDFDQAGRARKLQVADRFCRRAAEAVRGAVAVFVAVAPGLMRETLETIAPDLAAGAVVSDVTEVKEPVCALASDLLPSGVSFVGGHPVLWAETSALDTPSADLFARGVYCLTPLANAHPDSVQFMVDLAQSLDMLPYFLGPREHDAFFAGTSLLPAVLAAVLLRVVTRQNSWRELAQLAGGDFRHASLLVGGDPDRRQQVLGASREVLLRWLDMVTDELQKLREELADAHEPSDLFSAAQLARAKWLSSKGTQHERRFVD